MKFAMHLIVVMLCSRVRLSVRIFSGSVWISVSLTIHSIPAVIEIHKNLSLLPAMETVGPRTSGCAIMATFKALTGHDNKGFMMLIPLDTSRHMINIDIHSSTSIL